MDLDGDFANGSDIVNMAGIDTVNMSGTDVKGFHWADYLVFSVMLGMSFVVGAYQRFTGDRQRSTKEYLLGNRELKMFPAAVSMFMSYISAIIVLGNTAEMYLYGTQSWMSVLGICMAHVVGTVLYVPLIYNLKITSTYEYHEMRFRSMVVRKCCLLLDMTAASLYMGLAMYAPSTALEAVTGFPVWASILCTGGIATIYTTLGGLKAVVWTDFFQGFVMLGGLIVILIVGAVRVGGLSEVWETSQQGGRITFFDFNPDPTVRMTFWTASLGGFFTSITMAAAMQTHIQRYVSLPTVREACIANLLLIPCSIIVYSLAYLIGLTVYAYYEESGCDPLRSGKISNANQLLPYFVVDAIDYPGLGGLLVAVLFSGALSSVSSSMAGMSAMTWKDFLEPIFTKSTELRKSFVTKTLAFFFGVIGIGFAFLFQLLTGHVMELAVSVIAGGIGGPLAGVVFVGSIFPCVQWKGVLAGLFSGIFMTTWINVGQQVYNPWVVYLDTNVQNCTFPGNMTAPPIPENPDGVFWLYRLSFNYIGTVGWGTTILVALIVSFATGASEPKDINPRAVIDFPARGLCKCVPAVHRDHCYCGVDYTYTEEPEQKDQKDAPEDINMDRDFPPSYENVFATLDNKAFVEDMDTSTRL